MSTRQKRLWILIVVPALLILSMNFLFSFGKKENVTVGVKEGDVAPDFSLYDINGKSYNLKGVRGKKVVLLVFWATWCPYCVEEIPQLNKIYQEYSKKGLEVWVVNISEKKDKVSKFAANRGINYTVLLDSSGKIADLYQIRGIPANIILDKNGIIQHNGRLPENYEMIFTDLTNSLKKK